MVRLGAIGLATAAAFIALTPIARAAAPPCPTIEFAALQATGSKHASAQYAAYLKTADATPTSVDFVVGFEGRDPSRPVRLALNPSGSMFGQKNPAVLFVTPHADVEWIQIVSFRQSGVPTTDCSSAPRYELKATKIETPTFDDSAPWAHPYKAIQFTGAGQASLLARENAALRGMTGSSRLVAVVGADGIVKGATVLESSGEQSLDDAAIKAAMETRFHPARLPEFLGGGAIASVVDLSFTFTPGLVSVHVH